MSQWEYMIQVKSPQKFSFNFPESDWLNEQGKNGWQLVSVICEYSKDSGFPALTITNKTYYFKRAKAVPKKEPTSLSSG